MSKPLLQTPWFVIKYQSGHTMNRRERLVWRVIYAWRVLRLMVTGKKPE